MPTRNVEIKARLEDPELVARRARALGADGPRFLQQPCPSLSPQVAGRDNFHRHRPFQQRILSSVDDAHAAPAEFRLDLVSFVKRGSDHNE